MFLQSTSRAVLARSRPVVRRFLSDETKETTKVAAKEAATAEAAKPGWVTNPKFWGGMGALAGWGMSGAAIYDATLQGPEVISLPMTGVLIIYSSLFARWAFVVKPANMLLAGCHIANVAAQSNQMRRAMEHKMATGQEAQVNDLMTKAAVAGVIGGAAIVGGPTARKALTGANLGIVSSMAAADAGPFTVHFWAPMSKWAISGASFLELDRPTDKISLPQYTALTATGFFFMPYALLVTPINYVLFSVNAALFLSSGWHLGRKVKADFIDVE